MTTIAGASSRYGTEPPATRARERRRAGLAADSTAIATDSAGCSDTGRETFYVLRMLVICWLALWARSFVLPGLRRIAVSMFCSTFWLSTFAQFGVDGTNQLYFAASAN